MSAISASQSNEIELEGHLEEPRAALGEAHLPADAVLDPPQLHAPAPRHRAAVAPAGTQPRRALHPIASRRRWALGAKLSQAEHSDSERGCWAGRPPPSTGGRNLVLPTCQPFTSRHVQTVFAWHFGAGLCYSNPNLLQ